MQKSSASLVSYSVLIYTENHGSKSVFPWVINSQAYPTGEHSMLTDESGSLQTSGLVCFPARSSVASIKANKLSRSAANYSRGTKSKDGLCSLLGMSLLFIARFNSLARTGSALIGCLVNSYLSEA